MEKKMAGMNKFQELKKRDSQAGYAMENRKKKDTQKDCMTIFAIITAQYK